MAFQSTVRQFATDGIVGDFALDGPIRSQPVILQTSTESNNVIGRAVTLVAGTDGAAVAGGTGVFGGILTNSKQYASVGGSTGPLSPTLVIPNNLAGVQATTLAPGVWVTMSTTADVGDGVAFATATGILAAAPGGTPPASHTLIPGASVIRQSTTVAGLTLIQLLNS